MRAHFALALLLILPTANAADDAELERRIGELVPMLGSGDPRVRRHATRRLWELGEESVPALEKFHSHDPEVARALRALIRRTRTLKLTLKSLTGPHQLGSKLVLDVQLANHTDDTYLVSLTFGSQRGHGTESSFLVRANRAKPVRLRPDQVEQIAPAGAAILRPEQSLRVAITLEGVDSPVRRPGTHRIAVAFKGFLMRTLVTDSNRKTKLTELSSVPGASLETAFVEVVARGRKPAELDAALRSKNERKFASALAELELREDKEILTVLRKHIGNPRLRVRAIRRIGKLVLEQDLDLMRKAAGSRTESMEVRLAAVEVLGNYAGQRRARSRLIALSQSARLREAAVLALTKHKHEATIDCFVRLLQRSYHEGKWTEHVQRALLDWTDKRVENRDSEIDAFERWWREHRAQWISRKRK